MIYTETSYMVALRFRHDANHGRALRYQAEIEEERPLWNEWLRVEAKNTFRQLAQAGFMRPAQARQLVAGLDRQVALGYYDYQPFDWRDAMRKAGELSADIALTHRCRSADLLHIAIAITQGAERFVTLDEDQAAVADQAGLEVLVPR
jgi:predicted nucleic acid-binding protein